MGHRPVLVGGALDEQHGRVDPGQAVLDGPGLEGRREPHAWLPVLGPAPWVVWSTIARRLPPRGFRVWNASELERVNGLDGAALGVALSQLARYRLAVGRGDDVWSIRRTCPPLPDAL